MAKIEKHFWLFTTNAGVLFLVPQFHLPAAAHYFHSTTPVELDALMEKHPKGGGRMVQTQSTGSEHASEVPGCSHRYGRAHDRTSSIDE